VKGPAFACSEPFGFSGTPDRKITASLVESTEITSIANHDTNQLLATVTPIDASEESKSLSEGYLSGTAFLGQGSDFLLNQGASAMQDALLANAERAEYDTKSDYVGTHLGIGKAWAFNERDGIDAYVKGIWTRQSKDDTTVSTGDPLEFDRIDSKRLRIGTRYTHALDAHIEAYAGLACNREYDGEAKATTRGYRIDAPNLKGHTGIAEVGLRATPSKPEGAAWISLKKRCLSKDHKQVLTRNSTQHNPGYNRITSDGNGHKKGRKPCYYWGSRPCSDCFGRRDSNYSL
jgi:hypothetical protein